MEGCRQMHMETGCIRMKKFGILLSILLSASAFSAQAGSVYKWTDENGVIHFGDRQPTGQKTETVNVRSGTSESAEANGRATPQERVEAMDKASAEQAEKEEMTRQEEAVVKQRQKNCEIARENLKTISTHARIKVTEGGEQRYLSPEEIQKKKDEFQKIVEQDCNA